MAVKKPKVFPAFLKCYWHYNGILIREVFVRVNKTHEGFTSDFLSISDEETEEASMEHTRNNWFEWEDFVEECIGNDYIKATEAEFKAFVTKYTTALLK